jgi:3-hydroxyacyl-[acyl-carrier-protein] dehydratase
MPVLPASLIIEGMAQTAGILVGAARSFRENVILAKVVSVRLDREALPGDTLRYEATLQRVDSAGAAIAGSVSVSPAGSARWEPLGVIELMFSHVDPANPMPGLPAHNFVFGENFDVLLRSAGLHLPSAPAAKR